MKVTSKINKSHLDYMHRAFNKAQIMTVDAIKTDLQLSQTIPLDTGNLQNNLMFVNTKNVSKGIVSLNHEGPYARRLHFHPEYNFHRVPWVDKKGNQHAANPKAGGLWFWPYLEGGKKEKYAQIQFAKFLKEEIKNGIK